MSSFADSKNRNWELSVNVCSAQRVKDLTGIDITEIDILTSDKSPLNNAINIVNVIFALIKPQCEKCGCTDEDFAESMLGDYLESATEALITAIIDFFPLRQRRLLMSLQQKTKLAQGVLMEQMENKIESLDLTKHIELQDTAE